MTPFLALPAFGSTPLCAVLGVVLVAGFFHGLTGFGYALLVMASLATFVGFEEIRDLVAVLNPIVCIGALLPHWRQFNPRLGRSMILGACLGAPLGFLLLDRADASIAIRIFGGFLVGLAVLEWVLSRSGGTGLPAWTGLPCGIVGGSFGGAFNIGGPPFVAYCYARPWGKAETIATIQVAFILCAFIRIALMAGSGTLTAPLIRTSAVLVVPTLFAIWVGSRFVDRVDRSVLKILAFTFVAGLGLKYLCWG